MKNWRQHGCFCSIPSYGDKYHRNLRWVPRFSALCRLFNFLWFGRKATPLKLAEPTTRTYRTESRNPPSGNSYTFWLLRPYFPTVHPLMQSFYQKYCMYKVFHSFVYNLTNALFKNLKSSLCRGCWVTSWTGTLCLPQCLRPSGEEPARHTTQIAAHYGGLNCFRRQGSLNLFWLVLAH